MLELSCPAVNISQLLDVRMPAVDNVLNDPKMERRIRIDNHIVDQLKQVAEPGQKEGEHYFDCRLSCSCLADQFFKQTLKANL